MLENDEKTIDKLTSDKLKQKIENITKALKIKRGTILCLKILNKTKINTMKNL